MKKITSVKTRITIWYTGLMLILTAIVLTLVGTLSYRLSIENIEKDITLRVSQVADKVGARQSGEIFHRVDSDEEFKNVSIYLENGEYVVGQYLYDLSSVAFKRDALRYENVGGEGYIVYDMFKPSRPGDNRGYWIRGAKSVDYAKILGGSAFAILLVIIPFVVLVTALGGYYITKKAFSPVNDIIGTANEICTQNDIKKRIAINPKSKKDELYGLAVTLNQMLDKIENLINREKQFTSDASHELRTPISVILAQGEYLSELAENEKEKEIAENIVAKAKQLTKLVSSLLLLARIDQNRQKFNKEKVDIGALLDIAVDGLREEAKKKDILLFVSAGDGIFVEADEMLLLSAITNLVSNAVKYGKPSGNAVISASKIGNETEIVVRDNGIGFSAEDADKIWGRFYRADDARYDEYGSCGLGLAVVKSIVKLHGGEISAKSEPGVGSEFRIILKDD